LFSVNLDVPVSQGLILEGDFMDWREDFSTLLPIFLSSDISSQPEDEKQKRLVCSGGILGSREPTMLHIRGEFAVNTQVNGPKMNRFIGNFVTMLSVMVVFSSFAIAAYADRTEGMKYTKTTGTPSFGTEDWVGPIEQSPVVAMKTPSFGTEDWVGPEKQDPIVAMKTPSFGTEDWTGTMEFSEALGAGAIPEPTPEKLNLDDYNPD
jgi:hypothetical protein